MFWQVPRRAAVTAVAALLLVTSVLLLITQRDRVQQYSGLSSWPAAPQAPEEPQREPEPPRPRYKPVSNETAPLIKDNFPLAASASSPRDLPPIPQWNQPKHVALPTPLFIGFTRNWPVLQQAVVSYITAGWPPEDIYVVDNSGTMDSNRRGLLTLQNPFYLDYQRLEMFGVNILITPTLLSFAQLQNFYLYTSIQNNWSQYFWSHMDVVALSNEKYDPFGSLYLRAVEELRNSIDPAFGKWALRFFAYDRLALVNTAAYVDVGGWDTLIPFYGTDCDMHERLAMAGYSLTDAHAGLVYDVGDSLPDLSILYRQKDDGCPNKPAEEATYGIGDCRYDTITDACDVLQRRKNEDKRGRNYWQGRQTGGQDEPFYRDPEGFELGILMTIEHGKNLMAEKWGHRGCNLRGSGLVAEDAWRVEHDWDR